MKKETKENFTILVPDNDNYIVSNIDNQIIDGNVYLSELDSIENYHESTSAELGIYVDSETGDVIIPKQQ